MSRIKAFRKQQRKNKNIFRGQGFKGSRIRVKSTFLRNAGIQRGKKAGFPRVEHGAGLVKSGMTIKVKVFMTHCTSY
jgi:hypothetical protein